MQGLNGQPEVYSEQPMTVLKDVWETKVISITDTCQSAIDDEHFLKEIKFVSG